MALNAYSNYPKDSFLPGKQSQFADNGAHLSAKSQAKANSEKKSSNKIELSLAQLKEYARAQGFKLSRAYNKTFNNSSDWKIKDKTRNLEGLTEKADKALHRLMNFSSSIRVLSGMEKMGAMFKGVDVAAIQNPLYKALAMVLNGAPGKEQALAYLAHCILSEGRFFSGNPRRSKYLVLRLLRRFGSGKATLVKVRKQLHRARSEEKLHTVKQEIYWLSQGFGEGSSGPSYGQGDKQPAKASGPIKGEDICTQCKSPNVSTAKHKQDEQPKLGAVQVEAKDPLVLAQEKPPAGIPAAPAVPGNIPPPPPPPPPRLPALGSQKNGAKKAGEAAANKAFIPPKTRAQRLKKVWNAYEGKITKANDIIVFNDAKKKIEGEPRISADKIATVHPTIIAQLNLAQWEALNAYYFAYLTDEQQQAINPIVLRQLYTKLLAKIGIFAIAKDSKAQEIELKLACFKTTNVVHALSKVPPEDSNYNSIQVFIKDNCSPKERYSNGGANTQKVEPVLDQKRKAVLKALDYKPAEGEVVEQVTVAILDHFYDKPVERPQANARTFKVAVNPLEVLMTDREKRLKETDPNSYNMLLIKLMGTERGKQILAAAKAERLAKQQAEQEAARPQQSQENANANPFGGGNAGNRNANTRSRVGGPGNSPTPLSEWEQKVADMKAQREAREQAEREAREAAEAQAAQRQSRQEAERQAREAANPGRPNPAQQRPHFNNANNDYGKEYDLDAEPVNPAVSPNVEPAPGVENGEVNPDVNVNSQASQAAPSSQGKGNNGGPPPPPPPGNNKASNAGANRMSLMDAIKQRGLNPNKQTNTAVFTLKDIEAPEKKVAGYNSGDGFNLNLLNQQNNNSVAAKSNEICKLSMKTISISFENSNAVKSDYRFEKAIDDTLQGFKNTYPKLTEEQLETLKQSLQSCIDGVFKPLDAVPAYQVADLNKQRSAIAEKVFNRVTTETVKAVEVDIAAHKDEKEILDAAKTRADALTQEFLLDHFIEIIEKQAQIEAKRLANPEIVIQEKAENIASMMIQSINLEFKNVKNIEAVNSAIEDIIKNAREKHVGLNNAQIQELKRSLAALIDGVCSLDGLGLEALENRKQQQRHIKGSISSEVRKQVSVFAENALTSGKTEEDVLREAQELKNNLSQKLLIDYFLEILLAKGKVMIENIVNPGDQDDFRKTMSNRNKFIHGDSDDEDDVDDWD
jgi:hypothetical protein